METTGFVMKPSLFRARADAKPAPPAAPPAEWHEMPAPDDIPCVFRFSNGNMATAVLKGNQLVFFYMPDDFLPRTYALDKCSAHTICPGTKYIWTPLQFPPLPRLLLAE
jgi:hypothetical protein